MFRHLQQGGITTSDSSTVPIFSSAHLGNIKTSQYLRPHLVIPPSTVNKPKVHECDRHCSDVDDSWSKPRHQCTLVKCLRQGEMLWTKGKQWRANDVGVFLFLAGCLEVFILQIRGRDVNVWWLKSRALSAAGLACVRLCVEKAGVYPVC